MFEKSKSLYDKYKEIILYIIFGGFTTLVNFVIYFVLTNLFSINYLISNFAAWIGAVIFAFFTNKKYVFNANNTELFNYIKEFVMFTLSRGFSFLVETFLLFLGVELIKLNDGIVKVAVAVIVVILNYFFTKFVFKNKDEKKNIEKNTNVKKEETKGLGNNEVWYKKWYVIYTGLFFVISLFLFYEFILEGKSLVWFGGMGDGIYQHFSSDVYFGNYFRDIIINFFNTHELVIPMWDLTVGNGFDIFTTLNYYAFGDPLSLFYIFTPEKYAGYMYSFLVIFRLYLSGLFFILFCFKFNQKKMPAILGALGYAFCGYALYASIRHPFFINPMIYLPIILIGIENVLRGRKPYLFIFIVAVSLISNFYFLYMNTLAAVVYAFVRVLYLYKDKGLFLKKLLYYVVKFITYYIIAILLTAVFFLPIFIAFISSARASGQTASVDLFYNLSYYVNIFRNLYNANPVGNWFSLGFNIIIVLCSLFIFIDKSKQGKYLRNILILGIICLLFPVIGYIMNGFSYVSNRWCYIFAFLVCFISCYIFNDIKLRINKHKIYTYGCLLFLLIVNVLLEQLYIKLDKSNKVFIFNYIFILMGFLFVLFANRRIVKEKAVLYALVLIFIIQIPLSGFMKYNSSMSDYISEFKKYSALNREINSKEINDITKLDNDNIYRIAKNKIQYNYGQSNNVNGLSSFYSIQNKSVIDYIFNIGILGDVTYSSYVGYDNHIISNTLKGVKYQINKNTYNVDVYKDYKEINKYDDLTTYENVNALDLFYTYDSVIDENTFNSLSAYNKEYAMLQSVYLSNNDFIKPDNVNMNSKTILNVEDILKNAKYDKDDIEIKNDKIVVKKKKATIKLNLGEIKNSECYFIINGFDIDLQKKENKGKNLKQKLKYALSSESTDSSIKFVMDESKDYSIYILQANNSPYYIGKNNYVFNLGYYKDGSHSVEISLSEKGDYYLSDMKVVCQPMDDYDKYVNELKEDKVENFTIKGNTVSLNVNTKENKIGVLSIPYSKGWKAYVNGKEVEVLQANIDSMGVELQKGENEVVFKYCTPGLKAGALISFVTAIGCIIYIYIDKKKRKKAL